MSERPDSTPEDSPAEQPLTEWLDERFNGLLDKLDATANKLESTADRNHEGTNLIMDQILEEVRATTESIQELRRDLRIQKMLDAMKELD